MNRRKSEEVHQNLQLEVGSEEHLKVLREYVKCPECLAGAIAGRAAFNGRAHLMPTFDGASCNDIRVNEHVDGIEVVAPGADTDFVILYFHGGAHCVGSVWTHRALLGRLSRASGAAVIAINYRLAPENPFPAGLDDAYESLHWVRKRNPAASVAVAGDSAGGNLAFALLVLLAEKDEQQPVACVTFAPWLLLDPAAKARVKLEMHLDAGRFISKEQRYVTVEELLEQGHKNKVNPQHTLSELTVGNHIGVQYFQDHDGSDPKVSPCLASEAIARCFPPVLIHVDEGDPLIVDAEIMGRTIEKVGNIIELKVYKNTCHVFQAVPHLFPKEAADSMERTVAFLAKYF